MNTSLEQLRLKTDRSPYWVKKNLPSKIPKMAPLLKALENHHYDEFMEHFKNTDFLDLKLFDDDLIGERNISQTRINTLTQPQNRYFMNFVAYFNHLHPLLKPNEQKIITQQLLKKEYFNAAFDDQGKHFLFYMLNKQQLWKPIKSFLRNGMDANILSPKGENALHYLVLIRNISPISLINCFLEHGINLHQQNQKGETPLFAVVSHKNYKLASQLFKVDHDPSLVDEKGANILMTALKNEDSFLNNHSYHKFLKMVLDKVDIHHKDNEGYSAYFYFAGNHRSDPSTGDLLVKAGANVLEVGPKGLDVVGEIKQSLSSSSSAMGSSFYHEILQYVTQKKIEVENKLIQQTLKPKSFPYHKPRNML